MRANLVGHRLNFNIFWNVSKISSIGYSAGLLEYLYLQKVLGDFLKTKQGYSIGLYCHKFLTNNIQFFFFSNILVKRRLIFRHFFFRLHYQYFIKNKLVSFTQNYLFFCPTKNSFFIKLHFIFKDFFMLKYQKFLLTSGIKKMNLFTFYKYFGFFFSLFFVVPSLNVLQKYLFFRNYFFNQVQIGQKNYRFSNRLFIFLQEKRIQIIKYLSLLKRVHNFFFQNVRKNVLLDLFSVPEGASYDLVYFKKWINRSFFFQFTSRLKLLFKRYLSLLFRFFFFFKILRGSRGYSFYSSDYFFFFNIFILFLFQQRSYFLVDLDVQSPIGFFSRLFFLVYNSLRLFQFKLLFFNRQQNAFLIKKYPSYRKKGFHRKSQKLLVQHRLFYIKGYSFSTWGKAKGVLKPENASFQKKNFSDSLKYNNEAFFKYNKFKEPLLILNFWKNNIFIKSIKNSSIYPTVFINKKVFFKVGVFFYKMRTFFIYQFKNKIIYFKNGFLYQKNLFLGENKIKNNVKWSKKKISVSGNFLPYVKIKYCFSESINNSSQPLFNLNFWNKTLLSKNLSLIFDLNLIFLQQAFFFYKNFLKKIDNVFLTQKYFGKKIFFFSRPFKLKFRIFFLFHMLLNSPLTLKLQIPRTVFFETRKKQKKKFLQSSLSNEQQLRQKKALKRIAYLMRKNKQTQKSKYHFSLFFGTPYFTLKYTGKQRSVFSTLKFRKYTNLENFGQSKKSKGYFFPDRAFFLLRKKPFFKNYALNVQDNFFTKVFCGDFKQCLGFFLYIYSILKTYYVGKSIQQLKVTTKVCEKEHVGLALKKGSFTIASFEKNYSKIKYQFGLKYRLFWSFLFLECPQHFLLSTRRIKVPRRRRRKGTLKFRLSFVQRFRKSYISFFSRRFFNHFLHLNVMLQVCFILIFSIPQFLFKKQLFLLEKVVFIIKTYVSLFLTNHLFSRAIFRYIRLFFFFLKRFYKNVFFYINTKIFSVKFSKFEKQRGYLEESYTVQLNLERARFVFWVKFFRNFFFRFYTAVIGDSVLIRPFFYFCKNFFYYFKCCNYQLQQFLWGHSFLFLFFYKNLHLRKSGFFLPINFFNQFFRLLFKKRVLIESNKKNILFLSKKVKKFEDLKQFFFYKQASKYRYFLNKITGEFLNKKKLFLQSFVPFNRKNFFSFLSVIGLIPSNFKNIVNDLSTYFNFQKYLLIFRKLSLHRRLRNVFFNILFLFMFIFYKPFFYKQFKVFINYKTLLRLFSLNNFISFEVNLFNKVSSEQKGISFFTGNLSSISKSNFLPKYFSGITVPVSEYLQEDFNLFKNYSNIKSQGSGYGFLNLLEMPGIAFKKLAKKIREGFFVEMILALLCKNSLFISQVIKKYFEKIKYHYAFYVLLNYLLDSFAPLNLGVSLEISGKFRPRYGGKKVRSEKRLFNYGTLFSLQTFSHELSFNQLDISTYLGVFGLKVTLLLRKYSCPIVLEKKKRFFENWSVQIFNLKTIFNTYSSVLKFPFFYFFFFDFSTYSKDFLMLFFIFLFFFFFKFFSKIKFMGLKQNFIKVLFDFFIFYFYYFCQRLYLSLYFILKNFFFFCIFSLGLYFIYLVFVNFLCNIFIYLLGWGLVVFFLLLFFFQKQFLFNFLKILLNQFKIGLFNFLSVKEKIYAFLFFFIFFIFFIIYAQKSVFLFFFVSYFFHLLFLIHQFFFFEDIWASGMFFEPIVGFRFIDKWVSFFNFLSIYNFGWFLDFFNKWSYYDARCFFFFDISSWYYFFNFFFFSFLLGEWLFLFESFLLSISFLYLQSFNLNSIFLNLPQYMFLEGEDFFFLSFLSYVLSFVLELVYNFFLENFFLLFSNSKIYFFENFYFYFCPVFDVIIFNLQYISILFFNIFFFFNCCILQLYSFGKYILSDLSFIIFILDAFFSYPLLHSGFSPQFIFVNMNNVSFFRRWFFAKNEYLHSLNFYCSPCTNFDVKKGYSTYLMEAFYSYGLVNGFSLPFFNSIHNSFFYNDFISMETNFNQGLDFRLSKLLQKVLVLSDFSYNFFSIDFRLTSKSFFYTYFRRFIADYSFWINCVWFNSFFFFDIPFFYNYSQHYFFFDSFFFNTTTFGNPLVTHGFVDFYMKGILPVSFFDLYLSKGCGFNLDMFSYLYAVSVIKGYNFYFQTYKQILILNLMEYIDFYTKMLREDGREETVVFHDAINAFFSEKLRSIHFEFMSYTIPNIESSSLIQYFAGNPTFSILCVGDSALPLFQQAADFEAHDYPVLQTIAERGVNPLGETLHNYSNFRLFKLMSPFLPTTNLSPRTYKLLEHSAFDFYNSNSKEISILSTQLLALFASVLEVPDDLDLKLEFLDFVQFKLENNSSYLLYQLYFLPTFIELIGFIDNFCVISFFPFLIFFLFFFLIGFFFFFFFKYINIFFKVLFFILFRKLDPNLVLDKNLIFQKNPIIKVKYYQTKLVNVISSRISNDDLFAIYKIFNPFIFFCIVFFNRFSEKFFYLNFYFFSCLFNIFDLFFFFFIILFKKIIGGQFFIFWGWYYIIAIISKGLLFFDYFFIFFCFCYRIFVGFNLSFFFFCKNFGFYDLFFCFKFSKYRRILFALNNNYLFSFQYLNLFIKKRFFFYQLNDFIFFIKEGYFFFKDCFFKLINFQKYHYFFFFLNFWFLFFFKYNFIFNFLKLKIYNKESLIKKLLNFRLILNFYILLFRVKFFFIFSYFLFYYFKLINLIFEVYLFFFNNISLFLFSKFLLIITYCLKGVFFFFFFFYYILFFYYLFFNFSLKLLVYIKQSFNLNTYFQENLVKYFYLIFLGIFLIKNCIRVSRMNFREKIFNMLFFLYFFIISLFLLVYRFLLVFDLKLIKSLLNSIQKFNFQHSSFMDLYAIFRKYDLIQLSIKDKYHSLLLVSFNLYFFQVNSISCFFTLKVFLKVFKQFVLFVSRVYFYIFYTLYRIINFILFIYSFSFSYLKTINVYKVWLVFKYFFYISFIKKNKK